MTSSRRISGDGAVRLHDLSHSSPSLRSDDDGVLANKTRTCRTGFSAPAPAPRAPQTAPPSRAGRSWRLLAPPASWLAPRTPGGGSRCLPARAFLARGKCRGDASRVFGTSEPLHEAPLCPACKLLLHPLFDNACRTSHPHLIPGCCYSCFGSSLASCSQSHSLASGSSRGCVVLVPREGVGLKFTRELVWVHRFAFSLELPVSLAPSPSPRRAAAPR
jgi:hypothetical protein